jgi:hypothetical protein
MVSSRRVESRVTSETNHNIHSKFLKHCSACVNLLAMDTDDLRLHTDLLLLPNLKDPVWQYYGSSHTSICDLLTSLSKTYTMMTEAFPQNKSLLL